jgi:hypothetical protein
MTVIKKNIVVQKSIQDIFQLLYENNTNIFDSHMTLIKWDKDDWIIKKNLLKQRNEYVYVYIPSIPDEVVHYLLEKDKFLQVGVKNKFIIDKPEHHKIKTKFKILNVNPFFKTLINDLHIVNIKNTIELLSVNECRTHIKIKIKVAINIPKTKKINEFITTLSNSLMDSTISSLI